MARLLVLVAVALLLTGCGGSRTVQRVDADQTLLLDTRPAAVHAGIYLALERGYDDTEGVRLTVRVPGRRTDPVDLLTNGRVHAAIMDVPALEAARGGGAPLVAVMALRQRPLLTLVVTKDTLADHSAVVRALIRALQRGYTEALIDPESAVTALLDHAERLDRATVAAELDEMAPQFTEGAPVYGALPRGGPGFDTGLVGRVSRD